MILKLVISYFWISVLAFLACIFFPYYKGAVLPEQVQEAAIVSAFFLRLVAPLIAANTFLVNIVLIFIARPQRFWTKTLIIQVLFYFGISYLTSRPTIEETTRREEQVNYENIENAYYDALRKQDFSRAEQIFANAVKQKKSDFPNSMACRSAELLNSEQLAFSLRLQNKFADRLPVLGGTMCRVVEWAITDGQAENARVAIENGETFTDHDVLRIVEGLCCGNTGHIPEQQQLALFRLAVKHHFVDRHDTSLLAQIAVEQQRLLLIPEIFQSAGGVNGLDDKGAQAMIAAVAHGQPSIDLMLSLGVDVNVVGKDSHGLPATALIAAAESNNINSKIIADLLDHGADVRVAKGRAPLALVLEQCNVQSAKLLLLHGADPNATDPIQQHLLTPTAMAVRCADKIPQTRPLAISLKICCEKQRLPTKSIPYASNTLNASTDSGARLSCSAAALILR